MAYTQKLLEGPNPYHMARVGKSWWQGLVQTWRGSAWQGSAWQGSAWVFLQSQVLDPNSLIHGW